MALCELNKKLKFARQKGFIFIPIIKLTIKIYCNLSHTNISFYLKFPIPIMHRHCFEINSQNPEYVGTHCNYRKNPLQFTCLRWYLDKFRQSNIPWE